VIRHQHHGIQLEVYAVPRKTRVNHDLTHRFRKEQAAVGRESDEEGFEIGLIVRELAPVLILALHSGSVT